MKILHYSLGFPPYRSGGLTKFCIDLMKQQYKEGNTVGLLWPGKFSVLQPKIAIKERKHFHGIRNFEIINPLPVPYDEGILDVAAYTKPCDAKCINAFLDSFKPDVIHIHSFMGLHREWIECAVKKHIPTVFTTHDYFPICPKVTMFRNMEICNCAGEFSECCACNQSALGLFKIFLLQSHWYKNMKDICVVRLLRRQHRKAFYVGNHVDTGKSVFSSSSSDYKSLRKYYQSMIEQIDTIHYNSTVAKEMYEKYLSLGHGAVIPISHADVVNTPMKKEFKNQISISFLGPQNVEKGFFVLKEALDRLWMVRKDFKLNIYFKPAAYEAYMVVHDRYDYDTMGDVFMHADLLVCPSMWQETYGYTVLEALGYGVPVLVSDTVGAKDIVPYGAGIVIENITSDALFSVLQELDFDKLAKMNQRIIENKDTLPELKNVCEQIMEKCY